MQNGYIERYKNLICHNIEKCLMSQLNTNREIPTWFIGYLTETIDSETVTENTNAITIKQAELYLENDVNRLYKLINTYCYNLYMIDDSMKYKCIIYIIIDGLDKFLDSNFYRTIKYESFNYFNHYKFHDNFNTWVKTKTKTTSLIEQIKGYFK